MRYWTKRLRTQRSAIVNTTNTPIRIVLASLLLILFSPALVADEIWNRAGSDTADLQGGYANGNTLFICRHKDENGDVWFGKSINGICHYAGVEAKSTNDFESLSNSLSDPASTQVFAWVSFLTTDTFKAAGFEFVSTPRSQQNARLVVCQAMDSGNLHPGSAFINDRGNAYTGCQFEYKDKKLISSGRRFKILMRGPAEAYDDAYQRLKDGYYKNKVIVWPDYAQCVGNDTISMESTSYASYEPLIKDTSYDFDARSESPTGIYVEAGDRLIVRVSGDAETNDKVRLSVGHWETNSNGQSIYKLKKFDETNATPPSNDEICSSTFSVPAKTLVAPESGPVYLISEEAGGPGSVEIQGGDAIPQYYAGPDAIPSREWSSLVSSSQSPFIEIRSKNLVTLARKDKILNLNKSSSDINAAGNYWDVVLQKMRELTSTSFAMRPKPRILLFGNNIPQPSNVQTRSVIGEKSFDSYFKIADGDNVDNAWTYFHELGHSFQAPDWTINVAGTWTGEATNNLAALYAIEQTQGVSEKDALRYWNQALGSEPDRQNKIDRTRQYLEFIKTKNVDLFSTAPPEYPDDSCARKPNIRSVTPWDWLRCANSTASQTLFFYVIRANFGWDVYKETFKWYVDNKPFKDRDPVPSPQEKMDEFMVQLTSTSKALSSNASGAMYGYFREWGFVNSEGAVGRASDIDVYVAQIGIMNTVGSLLGPQ